MQDESALPAIDFREIPIHSGEGNVADAFELFARDFFAALGFRIVEEPARGRDLGRDLIIEELLRGTFVAEPMRWIVSAKHFAHSGESVRHAHELDPKGRVDAANAQGFIGFYSTLASSGLRDRLEGIARSGKVKIKILDRAAIEAHVLRAGLEDLFHRYFPTSWTRRTRNAEATRLIVAAESDPVRPEDEVAIDLSTRMRVHENSFRFADIDLERVMTAAILASELRDGTIALLDQFVSFHPLVWQYLVMFLRERPPDEKRFAGAIARSRNAFVLRLLISLAGRLMLSGCAKVICEHTLNCAYYDRQLRDRGYGFGISGFGDVVKRTLSAFDRSALPLIEAHCRRAKLERRWKAKKIFESAYSTIVRDGPTEPS